MGAYIFLFSTGYPFPHFSIYSKKYTLSVNDGVMILHQNLAKKLHPIWSFVIQLQSFVPLSNHSTQTISLTKYILGVYPFLLQSNLRNAEEQSLFNRTLHVSCTLAGKNHSNNNRNENWIVKWYKKYHDSFLVYTVLVWRKNFYRGKRHISKLILSVGTFEVL